jgi:hypothetical protein
MASTVFLTMPHYDGKIHIAAARAFYGWPSEGKLFGIMHGEAGGSLLARTFNCLWAQALEFAKQGKATHFAMLHGDCGAQKFWLDTLWTEMEKHDADIIGAVNSIKDHRNLTSIAIDNPANRFTPERRFTMHEILGFPDTFCAADAGYPGRALLVNTGCLLVDMRKPWVWESWQEDRPIPFTINDRVRVINGSFAVEVESEDWFFSRQAFANRARIFCTRKIRIDHYGEQAWPNDKEFGDWKHDRDCLGPETPESTPPPTEPSVTYPA